MNTRTAFITLATLLLCALPLRADGPDAPGDRILFPGSVRMLLVGPYGGIDYNMHKGTFSTTENGQSCCTFEEGTGLGLVIVQKIVQEHNGEILFNSAQGIGTTFQIRLPAIM